MRFLGNVENIEFLWGFDESKSSGVLGRVEKGQWSD